MITITITKLTYSEMLATIPWVVLLPKGQSRECQWGNTVYGRGKMCKNDARLIYFNLDGLPQAFCHRHLYHAKIADGYTEPGEPGHDERERNQAWRQRVVSSDDG